MLENIELDAETKAGLKAADNYYCCFLNEAVKLQDFKENTDERRLKTIPQFFKECCQKYKDLPALAYETAAEDSNYSKWSTISYAEYEQKVEQAALLLLHLGVQPRSTVAILAFNCPEWFYVELGAIRIGAVVAGIYTSNSAEAVCHVLETSEASVCLVDDAQQMSKVRGIKSRLQHLNAVVQLHGPFEEFVGTEQGYYRWKDLFDMQFSSSLREEIVLRESNVVANECALLIFTSGTVGMPKGVMISHENLLYCAHAFVASLHLIQDTQETAVTYLPLNHIAAQIFDIFIAIENGFLMYFADRNALKGSLAKTYGKANATILIGVPRVFEKMQEKVIQVEANSSRFSKFLMNTGRSLMASYHLDKMANKSASELKYFLASKIVNKIKLAMGLGHVKWCFVGGAPLTEETKKFFLSLDLPLLDVFGMSETGGPVTYNLDRPNLKTVGKPIKGVEIKIDNSKENGEGEILIRGRCNFMGYLKDTEKTLETLTADGWLRTGDMGYVDGQQNLYISGRLKELIITAGGENIPPVHIEELIKDELPCVSNAVVIGDHKKFLTVLLTLKTDINPETGYPMDSLRPEAIQWLQSLDLHYIHLSEVLNIKMPENLKNFDPNTVEINCDPKVWKALEEGIKRYNNHAISNAQKIQYFSVLPHDFSIPTNELGPTLKIKRNVVHKKYNKFIEKMYEK
ncbi:long-chain-fatty-acid--CoA ligase heimdall-like [Calliphora vicina]|uniref:long-chain-fatty-acid--CoA ligase heimdall-like n=1 Tax=Calliphora vicina TaxID=7373 RepID=UPI00325B8915